MGSVYVQFSAYFGFVKKNHKFGLDLKLRGSNTNLVFPSNHTRLQGTNTVSCFAWGGIEGNGGYFVIIMKVERMIR